VAEPPLSRYYITGFLALVQIHRQQYSVAKQLEKISRRLHAGMRGIMMLLVVAGQ
jgi:hypothetical protein